MTYLHRYQPLELALATAADAVIATDAQEMIIYLNPAAESMTSCRAVDALGQPMSQVFGLSDGQTGHAVESPLRRAAKSAYSAAGPTLAVFTDRSGRRVEVEYSTDTLHDEGGRLIGAVVVCRPLRLADPFAVPVSGASAAATRAGDAVISSDFGGRVSYLNSIAAGMAGRTQAAACGLGVDEVFTLIDARTRRPVPCPATRAIIEDRRVAQDSGCLLRRSDGSDIDVEVSAAPMRDRQGGVIGAAMVAHDRASAGDKSYQRSRAASEGGIAALPNHSVFGIRVTKAIADARARGRFAALMHVGIDRLKSIREAVGYADCNSLLEAVARRLVRCVRTSDSVGRKGDDVFVVLLTNLVRMHDAAICAEKILDALQSPYRIGDEVLRLSANVGIALYPVDADDVEQLLRCADFAMYQARYDGRNNYRLFSPRSPGDPSA